MTSYKEVFQSSLSGDVISVPVILGDVDFEAMALLEMLPDFLGKDNLTLGEAESVLMNALWWLRTSGSSHLTMKRKVKDD